MNRVVEEVLYGAMEDFTLDIIIGQGPAARTVKLDLPRFTLVGATTRTGLLSAPLRDRFGIQSRLNYYTPEELQIVILRAAAILQVEIVEEAALELAQMDRHILQTIIEKFSGGPVGLGTLAAAVSEEKDTLEDVYEPFLLLNGFIQRTPRGRTATLRAFEHLKLPTLQTDSHTSLF